jgi:hypothetical protein
VGRYESRHRTYLPKKRTEFESLGPSESHFASQIPPLLDLDPLFIEACTWVAGSVTLREQLWYC